MKAYTSRTRFDEARNFTGVFQQMGRVSLDSDWNEDVLIRTADARRRTHDLAHGSPDDGFLVSDEHLVDRIASPEDWAGSGLEAGDQRSIPTSIELARRDPESLPHVLRTQGHLRVRRSLAAPVDLNAIGLSPSGEFAADSLVFSVRFARPANDDDPTAVAFVLEDATGARASVPASFGDTLPETWHHERIPASDFAGIDLTQIIAWELTGLPPRALTWIDALRATDASLRYAVGEEDGPDFVIRGGDGSIAGAGRMLIDGVRTYLTQDVRYARQPDLPDAPVLADLPADGSRAHLVYADVWEQLVTAWDDPFIAEPALDGLDTTVRLRLVTQVKVAQDQAAGDAPRLPAPTGGGRITTNVEAGAVPDRYPAAPADPCRDRCLFTESASTGEGYTGSHNLHFRLEILHPGTDAVAPVIVWSRDNGSTRMALTADVGAGDTSLRVSREDALTLRAGDLVVLSDQRIDLQPDGPRAPVLRAVKGVDPDAETVFLEDAGYELAADPAALVAGGPVGEAFSTADRAYLRRWDGADWLVEDVRYNLPDGITFRLAGTAWRRGDFWSMTARIDTPDGASRGMLEQLTDAPVHGPVHHHVALSRITRTEAGYQYEDLRPRFLPLTEVRDQLAELAARPTANGAYTLLVGDGVNTFGDVDQDLEEGVTADEALQSAVQKLASNGGGTIYVRSGVYFLEKPVELSGCSRLRILGDGDASQLRVVGAGGAFIVDGCGREGAVSIERLSLVEVPREGVEFGDADGEAVEGDLPPLSEEVAPLESDDLIATGNASNTFADNLAASILEATYLRKRTLNAVRSTLRRLRTIQHENPGQPLEQVPEAADLMTLLRRLPHGVVTIADSRQVTLEHLYVESLEDTAHASGLFLTGSCADIRISDCRVRASTGVLGAPYGPYLSRDFFARNPRSGLYLQSVRVDGNELQGTGDAAMGIYLGDGTVRRARIENNQVVGFNVGIALGDRLDLGRTAASGGVIESNRVERSTGIGIDVHGHDVTVAGNRVEGADPAGLFQAGIRVKGSALRLRACEVVLPSLGTNSPARSPLAMIAGIVVGDGVDAAQSSAYRGPDTVQNVEIAGCHLSAADRSYPGTGVLIGGPGPVLDVRVRDSNFKGLGDAAVRIWGHGGRTGRIRVDDNRIEDVAGADVARVADARPAIENLSEATASELASANVDTTDAQAVLAALLASTSPDVIGPLEGVLRWIALRTLRAAVVFDHVEEGEIIANRIRGTGADEATQGDDVRTCAIATIAGSDIVVENNHIEHVVALSQSAGSEPGTPTATRPATFEALADLEVDADDEHADRADVHAATVALRRMILAYGGGSDPDRMRIGRRIYGAMDALVDDLDAFGGRGAEIGASLVSEAETMRTAQGRDDHTYAADRVRATLSRAAAYTAGGELAQGAWEAATQFDLAVVDNNLEATARRLQDAAPELAKGLDDERRAGVESAMANVLSAQAGVDAAEQSGASAERERGVLERAIIAASSELGVLGTWHDTQYNRTRGPEPSELFGSKQTIARRFAERLDTEADRLAVDTDAENTVIFDDLQADKDALVDTIRAANAELGSALEADWNALERAVTDETKARLKTTLAVITDWTEGGSGTAADTAGAADEAVARQVEAGDAALIGLVAKHIDGGIGKLQVEPAGVRTKNLKLLQSASGQLQNLVAQDKEAAELASKAAAAIRVAGADAQRRTTELANARTFLGAIGRRARGRVIRPIAPPVRKPKVEKLELRIAALGALAFSLADLSGSLRDEGLSLWNVHFERLLDTGRIQGRNRTRALERVSDAISTLARNGTGSAQQTALHTLMRQLDRAAASTSPPRPAAALAATLVLVRAGVLLLDAREDEATRLLRTQAYLRERASALSQSTLEALARQSSIATLTGNVHGVLERLALGERPRPPALAAPFFDQRLSPADGIFGAGARGRLRVADNQVQHAVRGVTLLGATGHPLAGETPQEGLVLHVAGNRLDGCALGGLDLRPGVTASLTVTDNEVFACAGIGEEGSAAGIGQAVALIAGTGDLVLQGNVLQGNGHRHARAVLHEIAIDWRGEAVVRGNTVRHVGGAAGGAGLLLVAEASVSHLPQSLSTAPFLGIEPPPRPKPPERPNRDLAAPTLPFLQTAVKGIPTIPMATDLTTSGRLVQRLSPTRIAPRLLTRAQPARATSLASTTAVRYLDREVRSPTRRLLSFVQLRPYHKPAPPAPPPEQRTFHVEGNDIAAYGPALLLVGEENGDLISTSIVGNGLHSEGGTGAAYVRSVDSLVFATNRCHAPETVNVVVVRGVTATMSITGNVIAGREPVAPPRAPRPPRPKRPTTPGRVTLSLPLGTDGALTVPIDPVRLRGSLETFSGEAQQAFSNVLVERAQAEQAAGDPFLPDLQIIEDGHPGSDSTGAIPGEPTPPGDERLDDLAAADLSAPLDLTPTSVRVAETSATPFSAVLSQASAKYSIAPFEGSQEADTVLKYIKDNDLGSRDVEAVFRGTTLKSFADETERKAFQNEVDAYRIEKKAQELESRKSTDTAVERAEAATVFSRVANTGDTQVGALATMTKLFTAQGFSANRTTAEVQALLANNEGNATKALDSLQSGIFAAQNATPTARRTIEDIGLIEKVLTDELFTGRGGVEAPEDDEEEEQEAEVTPDPYAHSLVILGGATVAAVGNSTTAGTLVQDAQESVELNV